MMGTEEQLAVPDNLNPLLAMLDEKSKEFHRSALYYDYPEPSEFLEAYRMVRNDIFDVFQLKEFQKYLVRELMIDTYHVNSYVQSALVDVYRAVEEILFILSQHLKHEEEKSQQAEELFYRLTSFESRLERSLQRGPVRWGFLKVRKFAHTDLAVCARYFYSLLWMFPTHECCLIPIEKDTLSVLRQIRTFTNDHEARTLYRAVRDVETLYWGTHESDIASLITVSSSLTFLTSLVFTTARIFSIGYLTNLAFYSAAASTLGAILAVVHLVRKFCILIRLWLILGERAGMVPEQDIESLKLVRWVTMSQVLLTVARFCAATAAAVALPFSVAELGFGSFIKTNGAVPFSIAFGSLVTAITSAFLFFIVEHLVRYRLSPELGPLVCNVFKSEIREIYKQYSVPPSNTVDTREVRERETWEYTAREFLHRYRFDTVFAADRFGPILQFVQSAEMQNPVANHPSSNAKDIWL
jgi:hypothetical protein